jgi:uncharacterized protein (TIGR03437 family)
VIQVVTASGIQLSPAISVTLTIGTVSTGGLTVGTGQMSFNVAPFSAAMTQFTSVSTTANTNTQVAVQVTYASATTGWLSTSAPNGFTVSSSSPYTNFGITVNPSFLPSGTYIGNVNLSSSAGTASITVTLAVGVGTSPLSASPNPINISLPAGSTAPNSQNLTVSSSSGPVSFTASAATATPSGGNWLTVNPAQTLTVSPGSNQTLQVTVNPNGLASSTTPYTGTITLTPAGQPALQIPVNLTIGGAATLSASPLQFNFAYQTGTTFPPAQTLTLSSNGAAVSFFVSATVSNSPTNWLVVNPQSGQTSGTSGGASQVSVQVNPSNLPVGTYQGQIMVSGSGNSQTIPVTLLVTNLPIITFNNGSTTFNYQYSSLTAPASQSLTVTSSGNQFSFTTATSPAQGGANFLTVNPISGTTPQQLTLSVNPSVLATLAPGTYTETLSIDATGAGNNPASYTVVLNVTNSVLIVPSQNSMSFNYEINQAAPQVQTLNINSSGTSLQFSATATTNNCGNFLSVASQGSSTPGNLAVSVNTAGLTAGTCTGNIVVTATGAGNSPLSIPVTLYVSTTSLLNVSPSVINLTTTAGTSPASQILALTSTDTNAINFTVGSSTNNGSGWLTVGPGSGSTPENLTVAFSTASLPVGSYSGTITISANGPANAPVTIPVNLTVTSSTTASATPSSLNFTQAFGGPAPAAQTVQIASSTSGLTYSTSASTYGVGTWLSVSPAGGTTNSSISVSVNGSGLNQGSYSGVVTVTIPGAANSQINIPVTLTIGPSQTLAVATTSLTYTYQVGATTTPAAQTVQVTSTGGNVAFTAAVSSSPSGLFTLTPTSGNTPASLSIGVAPSVLSTLSAGSYTGSVTVSSPSVTGSQIIGLTLTVQAAPQPVLTTIANGASNQAGAVSAGEVIAIFGTNIGPATPVGLTLTSSGSVSTTLSNTQVLFDNVAAPLIYASSGQINAIVPYEIAGRVTTNVTVQRNGVASGSLTLQVAASAPAIFSLSQGGNGQGAILNFDGTVNGASNPAKGGSVIVIYATGEGQITPPVATGSVTPATGTSFPKPVANVSVTIGGQPAQIQYAGEAPGLVSGVLQVNCVVPTGLGTLPQTIVLTVGSNTNSLQNITVAVD